MKKTMNDIWNSSRNALISTIEYLGFPAELGELIARQLGSPKAIDRMTAYLNYARPTDVVVVVDDAGDPGRDRRLEREKREL